MSELTCSIPIDATFQHPAQIQQYHPQPRVPQLSEEDKLISQFNHFVATQYKYIETKKFKAYSTPKTPLHFDFKPYLQSENSLKKMSRHISHKRLNQTLNGYKCKQDQTWKSMAQTNKLFKQGRPITKCPHTDKKYYAKGMCNQCYHARGRTILSTNCIHIDKPMYAQKMCINCYQSKQRNARR